MQWKCDPILVRGDASGPKCQKVRANHIFGIQARKLHQERQVSSTEVGLLLAFVLIVLSKKYLADVQ